MEKQPMMAAFFDSFTRNKSPFYPNFNQNTNDNAAGNLD